MIRQFDSIAAIAQEARRRGAVSNEHATDWYGNESGSDSLRLAETGDRTLVSTAEALIDQLETQIEVPRRVWEPSPAGAFCVVPDVLAGLPTYMRRQREALNSHSPISIIACSTISAGVTSEVIRKRGTAILALVMALSRSRPISLQTVATMDGGRRSLGGDGDETVFMTRIETAPLDLSMACWALTSPGFARRINYRLAEKLTGFHGNWPKRFNWSNQKPYLDYLTETLGPLAGSTPEKTLLIGPTHLYDPLADNPIPWLNTQITRFTTSQEDTES